MNSEKNTNKIIHIAKVKLNDPGSCYLLLRKKDDHFAWYQVSDEFKEETKTSVIANTIEEAMRLAKQTWKNNSFRTVICGFRYTLPERDEHGLNAMFHQMADSYASINGQYLDEELGHPCIVHNASQEALNLWRLLR